MYYSIENKTDKEVGNVFPQVSCISINLAHQIQFDEFSYFDSELLFELQPKAKLTDVLSQAAISARGLLVNQKVKDLFSQFNLMQHRYYKCFIKDLKGKTHEYFWLHLSDYSLLNTINYSKSKFYTKESGFREDEISLISFDDYKAKLKELGSLWTISSDYLELDTNFNKELDLFVIPIFDKHIYASEKLKEAIDSTHISGININKTEAVFSLK